MSSAPAPASFNGSTITEAMDEARGRTAAAACAGQRSCRPVIATMVRKGHWVARHPDCLNIVYIEGMNADGTPNGNPPNEFNDRRMVIRIGPDGVPRIEGSWEAAAEPGRYWTEHPMNSRGAARIAFGQFKSWCVGDFHGVKRPCWRLLRSPSIAISRRITNARVRRTSAISASTSTGDTTCPTIVDLGLSSAGCLVGRMKPGHEGFMALVKTDARYQVNPNYKFVTTIMPVEELTEIVMQAPVLAPVLAPILAPHPYRRLPPRCRHVCRAGTIDRMSGIAGTSNLARYQWDNRGAAPRGYIKGMAVTFGHVYSKWKAGFSAARVMAAANSGNDSTDALSSYDSEFGRAGMSNDVAGAATSPVFDRAPDRPRDAGKQWAILRRSR